MKEFDLKYSILISNDREILIYEKEIVTIYERK